jgi:hypothetical protein
MRRIQKLGKRYLLAAVLAAAISGIAVPAAEAATHDGDFNVSAGLFDNTWNGPAFSTHNKASTCVTITNQTLGWIVRLIWYDEGQNKVLWDSGFSHKTGRFCSGTKTMPRSGDKVYESVTAPAEGVVQGIYEITTN